MYNRTLEKMMRGSFTAERWHFHSMMMWNDGSASDGMRITGIETGRL